MMKKMTSKILVGLFLFSGISITVNAQGTNSTLPPAPAKIGGAAILGQSQYQNDSTPQKQQPSLLDKTKSLFGIGEKKTNSNSNKTNPNANNGNQTQNRAAASQNATGQYYPPQATSPVRNPQNQNQQVQSGQPVNQSYVVQQSPSQQPGNPQYTNAQYTNGAMTSRQTVVRPNTTANRNTQGNNLVAERTYTPPSQPASTYQRTAQASNTNSFSGGNTAHSTPGTAISSGKEESTLDRLSRMRGTIFEETASDRERMGQRKTDSLIVRQNEPEKVSTSLLSENNSATPSAPGITSTKKAAAKKIAEPAQEDASEIASKNARPALPRITSSQLSDGKNSAEKITKTEIATPGTMEPAASPVTVGLLKDNNASKVPNVPAEPPKATLLSDTKSIKVDPLPGVARSTRSVQSDIVSEEEMKSDPKLAEEKIVVSSDDAAKKSEVASKTTSPQISSNLPMESPILSHETEDAIVLNQSKKKNNADNEAVDSIEKNNTPQQNKNTELSDSHEAISKSNVKTDDLAENNEETATEPIPFGDRLVSNKSTSDNLAKTETTPIKSKPNVAVLDVEMNGPKKRIVGQESLYQFKIVNKGGAVAEHVVLSVEMPVWAEIQSTDFNVGTTNLVEMKNETHVLNWTIDRLEAGEEQPLGVHLIPRQRKSLTLSWDYQFKQPIARTSVEVQEPCIEMTVEGPGEMLWGSIEEFRLRIRNTGNGDAEEVQLTLLPSGTDPSEADTRPLGLLKAGEEKTFKVKAWAKLPDVLDIKVSANGPYGLQAETTHHVNVLRANLTAAVEGAEMQFVGNQAEYRVVVQNHGTAPARNVEIKAMIPSSAKYVSSQGGGRTTPSRQNQVIWNVDSIPVGEEFVCSLICEMRREGNCKIEIAANEKQEDEKMGASATASTATQVEAIADLGMNIENPQGPVEVGKTSTHVITITNRGTKTAEKVEVIAAFAKGVLPISVEGGEATINDSSDEKGGQVFFETIPSIGARQSIVLKVKAQAQVPGNHKIRVEMFCDATETHLVHEESSFYYNKLNGETATAPRVALKNEGTRTFTGTGSKRSMVPPRTRQAEPSAPQPAPDRTQTQPVEHGMNESDKTIIPLLEPVQEQTQVVSQGAEQKSILKSNATKAEEQTQESSKDQSSSETHDELFDPFTVK